MGGEILSYAPVGLADKIFQKKKKTPFFSPFSFTMK